MDLVRLGDCRAVENILQQKLVRADDTTGIQTPLLVRIFTQNRSVPVDAVFSICPRPCAQRAHDAFCHIMGRWLGSGRRPPMLRKGGLARATGLEPIPRGVLHADACARWVG